ncbi:prolyl oligopeptidase family serine peptidase [Flavobacterium sp. F372]|uniref:S9 family peptidase n=1 Tax=Flavobacterium bernardetii TaxID=2813823 RepID=A0ABR7IUC4_9FLAO|nr:S9 family peptidase [Flavobacterium bernardetii]MBC5833370.1 S9 family peptidase [Flavobacterium bernardetii]NHF68602.1 prolyl oligopeptidase family serine peptidase [Flavobacterium bernardetii]
MKTRNLIILLLVSITSQAQQFVGDWKGELDVQGKKLEIIFHITKKDNVYTSTMDVPMQGASGITLDKTEVNNNSITLKLSQMSIEYVGTIANNQIVGEFHQAGMNLPLTLTSFESKLPGNTTLPSSKEELEKLKAFEKGNFNYSVSDYFAKPKASSFQLSPNGKYMSYREKDENKKRHVYVKELATGKVKKAIEEKEELISGYGWINDERLYFSMDKGGDENFHIYGVNIDGSNLKDLTPFDGVQASIENILKEQKDYIIVSMNKNNKQVFEPFKLNIVTGDLVQLYKNEDIANPIQGYQFDKDGNLRGYTKLVNGVQNQFYYKDQKTGDFKLHTTTDWNDTFSIISFNYASKNKDEAYALTNLDSDKTRIVLYDLATKKIIKEVFSNPTFDVSGLNLARKRNYEIDNFSYEGEKNEIIPVSKLYKDIYGRMQKEFPNKEVSIVDYDDNETQFLITVQSDKLFGTYYQYDAKTKKFKILYDLMPQLKEADMAEMRPIQFKSRDGKTIYGYITLPKEALQGKKVPLIVNPHGGPQGVRDSWGFNPETQLFASRGYATLQVNFRISGGYGKDFLSAGFKQIGRKLMNDVEDGVAYAIEQGWVEKDKIAIYGASHGGYATLMGLVKTPDLYTCGVNYVGVSNIFTFFDSFPEYWKPYKEIVKQIWYDLDNPKEAAIAKEVSPVFQIDKIKKPLFVIQGANDPRVNIAESDQIVTGLRSKGFDVPYMVKYNEGHGFGKEENSIDMYEATLGFFAKNLKK